VSDDLDLELDPPPLPLAPGPGRRYRRVRNTLGVVAVVAAVAGISAAVLAADDLDRTATDTRPAPSAPPVMPAPGGGGAVTGDGTGVGAGDGDVAAAFPPAPASPPVSAVVEGLALRADGGIGPFAFGAPMDAVMAEATTELGAPVSVRSTRTGASCADDPRVDPGWTAAASVAWDDILLRFAGTGDGDRRLVGWSVLARPGAGRRFRMADGPAVDGSVVEWRASYGSAVEVHPRLAGDGGQTNMVVHLPEGDVSITGRAAASANAVSVTGGTPCAWQVPT